MTPPPAGEGRGWGPPSPKSNGAGDRTRTGDILLGRQMLYLLSYARAPFTVAHSTFACK